MQRPRSLPSTWKPGCAEHQNSRDLGGRPSIAGRQGVERRPRGGRAWTTDACRPRRRQAGVAWQACSDRVPWRQPGNLAALSARPAGIEGAGPQSQGARGGGGERRPRGGRAWPADACRPRRRQGASVQRPRSLAPTWKSDCAERQNSGD